MKHLLEKYLKPKRNGISILLAIMAIGIMIQLKKLSKQESIAKKDMKNQYDVLKRD